jgi:hypothetical protein
MDSLSSCGTQPYLDQQAVGRRLIAEHGLALLGEVLPPAGGLLRLRSRCCAADAAAVAAVLSPLLLVQTLQRRPSKRCNEFSCATCLGDGPPTHNRGLKLHHQPDKKQYAYANAAKNAGGLSCVMLGKTRRVCQHKHDAPEPRLPVSPAAGSPAERCPGPARQIQQFAGMILQSVQQRRKT